MSYLSGIYLESWFSWLEGWVQKTLSEIKKQTESKTSQNEEKKPRIIQGKSNNNNKHLWLYLLHIKKIILLKSIV